LNIPTFAEFLGTKTTLPDGKRTPPWYMFVWAPILASVIFENVASVGLYVPTFEEEEGTNTTFPFGASTPPANAPSTPPTVELFEYAYEIGLNIPTFELKKGTKTTFPFGINTPPQNLPEFTPPRAGTATLEKSPDAGLKNPTLDEL